MLYVLASKPVPSAAPCSTCRISPDARDTTVPSAISRAERAGPPFSTVPFRAGCRPLLCSLVAADSA
ncbi:hypothetical protein, partial [Modestobacter roseus]|uniref:hypothetical protein n=1 Tax=Modestobacter roseus TaxID=1181884 RepID=UPI0034DF2BE2